MYLSSIAYNMRYMFEMSRPWAWITITLLALSPQAGNIGANLDWTALVLSALGLILIVSGGFAVNDYVDRDLDASVHPDRVIPNRRLTPRKVLGFSIFAFFAGGSALAATGVVSFLFGLGAILLLIAYSPLKNRYGLWGNLVVALLITIAVVYGNTLVGHRLLPLHLTLIIATVFLGIFAREIVKDIEDEAGERGHRNTIPIQIGTRPAFLFAATLLMTSLFFLTAYFTAKGSPAAFAWAIPMLIYGVVSVIKLTLAKSEEQAKPLAKLVKWGMIGMVIVLTASY